MSEPAPTCIDCGEPTEWVGELVRRLPGDPVSPFRCCPRCARSGRFRRRIMRMWRSPMREQGDVE